MHFVVVGNVDDVLVVMENARQVGEIRVVSDH